MYENSIIIVKKLVLGVQEFFNSFDFTFRKKLSPFHIAGHSGIIELFEKIFFSNNGNVNTIDSFGWKPLHFAAWRIIKKCNNDFEEFEDLWKQIINKAPIEAHKEIGMESERLFWKKIVDTLKLIDKQHPYQDCNCGNHFWNVAKGSLNG